MNVVSNIFSSLPLASLHPLLGDSEVMAQVFRAIERVGPTDANVLVTGASGTGKALVAQSIHERSARRNGPFIAMNCGAIPAGLIDVELFGHEQAAGTSAGRAGVFERAQGGTLLFDEFTEMPLAMQGQLLRVLETRKFSRIGATIDCPADVRVIASTHRCPLRAVQSGQLREQLLYRLAEFPLDLPSLHSRGDDTELLAEHFLADLNQHNRTQKRLSASSRMTLKQHSWPGNVRELKNSIERAFILSDQTLELAPLVQLSAVNVNDAGLGHERLDIRVGSRIDDMERSLIVATLEHFKGNKRRASDALGCSLKTLYNKLNGYSQSQECASN